MEIHSCFNFFSQRTFKHWNSLPEHVVSASSVNCFNFKVRAYCGSRTAWIHVQSGTFKSNSSTSSIKYQV